MAATAPPIAIRCECGAETAVPYRQRWTCPDCARQWNTAQIPEAEYTRRNRQMNRYRLEILVCAVLLLVVFVPLVLFVSTSYVFPAIIVGLAWMFFYMPFWRRRVRKAASNAPRWELTPE